MRQKTKSRADKVLLILAVASFLVAAAEGFFFYETYENLFFRVLLIVQNSIKAFFFRADISLKDALEALQERPDALRTAVGYAYGVVTFTAPYCTIATIYKILEKLFHFVASLRGRRAGGHVVIFGENDDVKTLLANLRSTPEALGGRKLHLVCTAQLPAEERYRCYKAGWLIHVADLEKAAAGEHAYLLHQCCVDRAAAVLLMEESAVSNFSLLQVLSTAKDKKGRALLRTDAKVFCRCEDDGMRRIIEDYFDDLSAASAAGAPFDLEIIDVTELQIREMFAAHPIHARYWTGEGQTPPAGSDPRDWAVHLLILGLGRVGQQALLQAMNLGVAHSENPILIDVVDYKVDEKAGIFCSRFSSDFFRIRDEKCAARRSAADGSLAIRFHQMDVRYKAFRDLLETMGEKQPYTYVVIALEDSSVSIHCMTEVQQYFLAHGIEHAPILLRMDTNRILSAYLEKNERTFRNVYQMRDRRAILSLDKLFAADFDRSAKEFNRYYSQIKINGDADAQPPKRIDAETAWRALSLFQRNSSRALAYHQAVKERSIPCLAGEAAADGHLTQLLCCDESGWRYLPGETARDFVARLEQDPFALEMAKLEHRRWCYYMASIGWSEGERDNMLRRNPCMTDWERLKEEQPETCVYDLMPLMLKREQTAAEDT